MSAALHSAEFGQPGDVWRVRWTHPQDVEITVPAVMNGIACRALAEALTECARLSGEVTR